MTRPGPTSPGPGNSPAEPTGNLRDSSFLISLLVAGLIGLYLLLTSTSFLLPGIWPYDAKRILQFGLLFVLFLLPALNGRIRGEFATLLAVVPSWLQICVLSVAGWGVISALVNAQSVMQALNSLSEVALLSVLMLGIFVVAACRRIADRWFDRIAIAMIALTGLAVGLQDLVGVVAAHFAGVEFNFDLSLIYFSWPRFYNQAQSWMVPALVALPLLFTNYRLASVICFIVLGLHWYIILSTGARGSFVSLSAAIVFATIFLPSIRNRLLKWQASGLALGTLVFVIVMFAMESNDQADGTNAAPGSDQRSLVRPADQGINQGQLPGGESSFFKQSVGRPMIHTSGRTWMWSAALNDARTHPVLGIGPMNYVCAGSHKVGHPHNFPLQLAAEWGAPAALAACGMFGFLLWRISRCIRGDGFGSAENGVLAGLLFTGVLAAALHACLSGVMVMPASQVTGLLVCGMLLGLYPSAATDEPVQVLRWVHVPGLLLTVGLLGLGAQELSTMDDREQLMLPREVGVPRTWQQSMVCRQYQPRNKVRY